MRPASVGGLQAPTTWIRSSETQVRWRQKPRCSIHCLTSASTRCVAYRSGAGRLISSQKRTRRRPGTRGTRRVPAAGVCSYTACASSVRSKVRGVVCEDRFRVTTSTSGRRRSAVSNTIVLPEPGGPHRTTGRSSCSHACSKLSCRTVSMVGTTVSPVVNARASTSICTT